MSIWIPERWPKRGINVYFKTSCRCNGCSCHFEWNILQYLSRSMTKQTKWHVRPVKTQITLGIRPVWSESSLSAWRSLRSLATLYPLSAQRRLWSDWADAQADLSLHWAHMSFRWISHDVAHFLSYILFYNWSKIYYSQSHITRNY